MKKLFGHPDSGHAYKVRFFLVAAQIEHTYEKIDIWIPRDQRSTEFQRIARFGEVPVLLDKDTPYTQSNAILLHLAQQTNAWGGQNADALNRCTEWLMWEANKIGMCLPQLRSRMKFESDTALDDAFDWLCKRYTHDIDVINKELADGRQWIIGGERPSIADFSLCGYLFFAAEADLHIPANVQKWLDRLSNLKGWKHPYELLA